MIRGTTPTLQFILPLDTSQLAEAFVTIAQNGVVVIDKQLSDCECSQNGLTTKLTQEETLKLECDCVSEIQIRARTLDGNAIASNIIRVNTERILRDGVI
jgi:hypothetical protein